MRPITCSVLAMVMVTACSGARREPAEPGVAATAPAVAVATALDAGSASDEDASRDADAADAFGLPLDVGPPRNPLETLFDGDPSSGDVRLDHMRCAPGCLRFPTGWLATDDAGMVYAWFFRGEGQFTTAEVMRCPLPKLEDAKLAVLLKFAGGEKVTWSPPIDGVVGQNHARAQIAEGTGTARGKKARFWYVHVDVGARKDLVIAWVADGEPQRRVDEVMAVVRSVGVRDGVPEPR